MVAIKPVAHFSIPVSDDGTVLEFLDLSYSGARA